MLRVLTISAAALVILFICTQMIWPALRGRPIFPMLNLKRRKLRRRLQELRDAEDDVRIKQQLERMQVRITELDLTTDREVNEAYDAIIRRQEREK